MGRLNGNLNVLRQSGKVTIEPSPESKSKETDMDIQRAGTRPSQPGPAEWFTGIVRIDPLFQAPEPARAAGSAVRFEPGACTAWQPHPLGQTLLVLSGAGRVQREGGPTEEIHPGDVVWFAAGEKHWHGAVPHAAMTHSAIQEAQHRRAVDWLEHVTGEQYGGQ